MLVNSSGYLVSKPQPVLLPVNHTSPVTTLVRDSKLEPEQFGDTIDNYEAGQSVRLTLPQAHRIEPGSSCRFAQAGAFPLFVTTADGDRLTHFGRPYQTVRVPDEGPGGFVDIIRGRDDHTWQVVVGPCVHSFA